VKGQLWGWTRKTGYNHIIAVMKKAALSGPRHAEGLRHGYAVACIEKASNSTSSRNCSGMHR